MPVKHVSSEAEFRTLMSGGSTDRLVLVDYSAKWCGPCRGIAPTFEALSDKHGHANFLFVHVDVDECGDVSQEQRVRALPTFVFYHNNLSSELSRMEGADKAGLEAKIKEYGSRFKAFFGGEGNKLGGDGSGVKVGNNNSGSGLSQEEIVSVSQANVEFGAGAARVAFRFAVAPGGVALPNKPTLKIDPSDKVSSFRKFIDSVLDLSGVEVSTNYELHRTHPPGKLDEDATVNDAGVAGSIVMVKFV